MDASGRPRLDEQILDCVLTAREEGASPLFEDVLRRFPGRESEVEAAIDAVCAFDARVQVARRSRITSSVDGHLPIGTELGDFVIVELLGLGAMGVVYRATQTSLGGREVALKVLPPSHIARDPRRIERFRREAILASGVHDPHVADVHSFGVHEGLMYFAMRLVDGPTLASVLSQLVECRRKGGSSHLSRAYVDHVARLGHKLALGLSAIHAKGLVHRDVKPGNIILERAAHDPHEALNSRPVLVDFGLVREVGSSEITQSQTILGTPAYASPEARLGHATDARTDVYSAGVVLRDLLLLQRPRDRRRSAHDLRALNPAVDERLAGIVDLALEERVGLRYEDGARLAEDLQRYLDNKAVRALPSAPWSRLRLWVRRHPTRAARYGGMGLLLAGVLLLIGWVGQLFVGLHSASRHVAEAEAIGDLEHAARSASSLHTGSVLVGVLPWLQTDLQHADEYYSPTRGVLTEIGSGLAGTDEDCRTANLNIRRLLRTTKDPKLREILLRVLLREMSGQKRMQARVLAAETMAYYLRLRPIEGEVPLREGAWEQRLLTTLQGLLRVGSPDSLNQDLRYFALAALSGVYHPDALAIAAPWLAHEDFESRRLAESASRRVWQSLRADERLSQVAKETWIGWLHAVHLGVQRINAEQSLDRESSDACWRLLAMWCWTRWIGAIDRDDPTAQSSTLLQTAIAEIETVFGALSHREVPESSEDLRASSEVFGLSSGSLLHGLKVITRQGAGPGSEDQNPGNTLWGSKVRKVEQSPSGGRGGLSLIGQQQGPIAKATGVVRRAVWPGAVLRQDAAVPSGAYLTFSAHGAGVLDLECVAPSTLVSGRRVWTAESVEVTVDHGYATCGIAPHGGSVRVEISIDALAEVGTQSHTTICEVPTSHKKLTINEKLAFNRPMRGANIRIAIRSATTSYRLYGVEIAFLDRSGEVID